MPQTNAIRVISDIYSIIKVEKLPPAIRELACLAVVQSKSIEVTYPTTSNELCNYPQMRVTSIKVFCVPSYRPVFDHLHLSHACSQKYPAVSKQNVVKGCVI